MIAQRSRLRELLVESLKYSWSNRQLNHDDDDRQLVATPVIDVSFDDDQQMQQVLTHVLFHFLSII